MYREVGGGQKVSGGWRRHVTRRHGSLDELGRDESETVSPDPPSRRLLHMTLKGLMLR